ncbi:MAG: hypothetical protein PHR83_04695 [Paludibacter sp.]|nr:hypothetical protein [Paludibacter sp.]
MTKIRNSIWAGIFFGVFFGTVQGFTHGINAAIITGPLSGLLFGTLIHLFVNSKVVKRQTQIETQDGESIIHSGGANHLKNSESVGGKLYLLTDKLQFKSHSFNIQNHELVIYIDQIKDITLYNNLGIVPNGLAISLKDGRQEKFVVNGRQLWKTEIEKLRAIENKT